MELQYEITKDDFIAFNLDYWSKNALVQRSILMTRIATAVIVLLGGTALMVWLKSLNVISVAVYVALAAVCFFGTPWYMKRKVVKNVERILKNPNSKNACGEKKMVLGDDEFRLTGENEDTSYPYDAVQRIATDAGHYFVFVDQYSALIVPFRAFRDGAQKKEFYGRITAHIEDEALKC